MLTINQFRILLGNIIALLLLVSIVLMGMLEFKNLYIEPSVLVLQTKFDGKNDRIIKTKDSLKEFDTIFESPNIQDFGSTKTQLIVTTGLEDGESRLQLVNLKSKEVKKIEYSGKFVGNILAGGDRFVMQVENIVDGKRTYSSKLGIIEGDNPQVKDFNPQFLASAAYSIFLNPNGSLLVFTGVANNQFIVDLDNPDSITKLTNTDKFTLGFINEHQIAFDNYTSNDKLRIELLDINTNQSSFLPLGNPRYDQIAINKDGSAINYTEIKNSRDTTTKGFKAFNYSSVYFIPNYSFEKIQLDNSNDFLLFEKTLPDKPDSLVESFAIYHLKTKYLSGNTISGIKAVWSK